MKHYFTYISIALLLIAGLVSCSQNTDLKEGSDPVTEPTTVNLGFGLDLESSQSSGVSEKSARIAHNYETTGYTVTITGNTPEELQLTNVDLNEDIILEVTGSVIVTVKHPSFKKNKLTNVAYYGCKNLEVPTYEGGGIIPVPLELVQGFVTVTASQYLTPFVEKVKIGKDEVEMNTVYYRGDNKKIEVEVQVLNTVIEGEHDNIIGEGVEYTVQFSDIIGSQDGNPLRMDEMENLPLEMEKERKSF